jgi:hypothetical protein
MSIALTSANGFKYMLLNLFENILKPYALFEVGWWVQKSFRTYRGRGRWVRT